MEFFYGVVTTLTSGRVAIYDRMTKKTEIREDAWAGDDVEFVKHHSWWETRDYRSEQLERRVRRRML